MRINTNTAALRACYQLNSSDAKLSTSLGKLSSGSKLTDIRENPVGASLSVKMKTQIRNLGRASQNTSDGISVVETAESALAEVESMLQRMNELAVQGANETYTDEDRENIMSEINQLNKEIDRISTDTDFNTRVLLNGSLSRATYTDRTDTEVSYISSEVEEGEYVLHFIDTADKASADGGSFTQGAVPEGSVNINGAIVKLSSSDTLTDVYNKYMEAAEKTGLTVVQTGDPAAGAVSFTFTQKEYGSDYSVVIKTDEETARALGIPEETTEKGKDATATAEVNSTSNFKSTASVQVSGRTVTIKDAGGFEMQIKVSDELNDNDIYITAGVSSAGSMSVQVGANEYQVMEVEIPRVDSETLKTDKILAYTSAGCAEAITITGNAINIVSKIRGDLGAYQNRMEHTVLVVDATEENMTASLSRIEDVDMAEEMTQYTTYNVITQAATSMLAQANQLPEKVLQLLQ